jgi:hypothetical protein
MNLNWEIDKMSENISLQIFIIQYTNNENCKMYKFNLKMFSIERCQHQPS